MSRYISRKASPVTFEPLNVCRFSYTATNFLVCDSGCLYSEYHIFSGYQWRLRVFPGTWKPRHVSAYLECAGATGAGVLPEDDLHMSCTISVIPEERSKPVIEKKITIFFDGDDAELGWASLCRLSDVKPYIRPSGAVKFAVRLSTVPAGHAGNATVVPADVEDDDSVERRRRCSLLWMLEQPDASHADIRLKGREKDAQIIRAHRCVVSSYEFFAKMFCGSFEEAHDGGKVVSFDDISGHALRIAVQYMYGEDIPDARELLPCEQMSQHAVQTGDVVRGGSSTADSSQRTNVLLDIYRFASVHFMEDLVRDCSTHLYAHVTDTEDQIQPDLLVTFLRTSIQLSDFETVEKLALALHKMDECDFVACSKELMCLTIDEMEALLLDIPANLRAYKLAERWTKHDKVRLRLASRVFRAFQIDDMTTEDLSNCVEYAFARSYAPSDCFFRVIQKLSADLKASREARMGELELDHTFYEA